MKAKINNNLYEDLGEKLRKNIEEIFRLSQELLAITTQAIEANPKKVANFKKAQVSCGMDIFTGFVKNDCGQYVANYSKQDPEDGDLLLEELSIDDLTNIASVLIDMPETEF